MRIYGVANDTSLDSQREPDTPIPAMRLGEIKKPGRDCHPAGPASPEIPEKEQPMNSGENSIPPTGIANPCPVVVLAVELCNQRNRYADLETSYYTDHKEFQAVYYEIAMRNVDDIDSGLRDMITCTEASSLEGAAVQISEALSRVNLIHEAISDGTEAFEQNKQVRAIDRLLYSALRALEDHCAIDLNKFLGGTMIHRNMDPWRPVEEVIEDIRSRRSVSPNAPDVDGKAN